MSNYILSALNISASVELSVIEFVKAVHFPIDMFMIDKFWNTIEDDQYIYVNEELIRWMGYEGEPMNVKKNFKKLILSCGEFLEYSNEEYQQFLENHTLPRGNPEIYPPVDVSNGKGRTRHILLSPKCLKTTMMRVGTARGDQVREYYFALESLFKTYIQYQSQFRTAVCESLLRIKDTELQSKDIELQHKSKLLENTQLVSKELLSYKLFISKSETLYIITSRLYAAQGIFKIGKTKSLKSRLSQLNTAHAPGDELFVAAEFATGNSAHLEARVHYILQHHRIADTKEFFHLPFQMICRAINRTNENLATEEELINDITQELYNLQSLSPDAINWSDGVIFPEIVTEKIEPAEPAVPPAQLEDVHQIVFTFTIKGWTTEQTKDFIVNVLNEYKVSLANKKPSWTTLSKHLMTRLKPHSRQPNITSARDQIMQLCRNYDIVFK